MRRGRNGLAALVQEVIKVDPFSSALFCFVGRRRNQTIFCIPIANRRS
jgi:transposase